MAGASRGPGRGRSEALATLRGSPHFRISGSCRVYRRLRTLGLGWHRFPVQPCGEPRRGLGRARGRGESGAGTVETGVPDSADRGRVA